MEPTSVAGVAKLLTPLAQKALQEAKQLHAERTAASAPAQLRTDLLDERLQQTLDRLRGPTAEDGWWRSLFKGAQHLAIASEFFRKPAVQDWLRVVDVQNGVKALARAKVLNKAAEEEGAIRKRLAESYSDETGEAVGWAEQPIDAVVACLAAGYIASIPSASKPVVEVIQASHGEVTRKLDDNHGEVTGKLDDITGRLDELPVADPLLRDTIGRMVEKDLAAILDLRAFDYIGAITRAAALWQRVDSGDLSAAARPVKDKVRYWAARLVATVPDRIEEAQQLRQALPEGYPDGNVRVLDALILVAAGEDEEAIRLLRDDDDPDAKSLFLGLLARFRGIDAALSWCADVHPQHAPDHFTNLGWREWATCLAKSGRWEEAAEGLNVLASRSQWAPALAMTEGSINAALLLAEGWREMALEGVPTHLGVAPNHQPAAKLRHSRASECFKYVEEHLPSLADDGVRQFVDSWQLWLHLMDPDDAVTKSATQHVRERLERGHRDGGLMQIAWSFQIPFNGQVLRRRLQEREQLGGLDDQDVVVECLLNQMTMAVEEFAQYIEKRLERLDRAMPQSLTTVLQFGALLESGQVERAREALEARRQHVEGLPYERMLDALRVRQGVDPRESLEARYKRSGDLIDLRNLITHLKEVKDRTALEPRVRELFTCESTLESAYEVVQCLSLPPTDHPAISRFLEEYPNFAEQNPAMKSALAWSFFHTGRVRESREANDALLRDRRHSDDLYLDINIAIATGNWERLGAIVDREWSHRDELPPDLLIHLAHVASQGGQSTERPVSLARLAAAKAPKDPRVLAAAYAIHFKLGRDEEADSRWLAQALEHSSEDEGPVWTGDLDKLVNHWGPQLREHNADIERKLLDGSLPMVLAASALNLQLSRLLLADTPAGVRDGRRRLVLPIIAAQRERVDIQEDWTVGLDLTSIMVLARLHLLDATLDALHHARVAYDTMACLLAENAEVRFHQPALVDSAREVRKLIARGHIGVVESRGAPALELSQEVGTDLAMLLEASRENGGVVICAKPIHKAGSLMEEIADTSDYDDVILSPADLCDMAHRTGRIDKNQHERSRDFLKTQGQVARARMPRLAQNSPIYVDRLALSYLQTARVLEALANSGLDLMIHPNVSDEMNAFVEAGEAGEHLAESVQAVKEALRCRLESGDVSLMPHPPEASEAKLGAPPSVSSIQALLCGAGECDALCVDDRFINRHPVNKAPSGELAPVVCVLDVLRYLRSRYVIDDAEYWAARHKLRDAGFAFIPVEADELLTHLLDAECDKGQLLETPELRTIRQTVNRLDFLGILNAQEAPAWSEALMLVGKEIVQRLWLDDSISSANAAALSTWVWRYLPVPTCFAPTEPIADGAYAPYEALVSGRVALQILPRVVTSAERHSAYREWLKAWVIAPLRPANPELIENATSIAQATVEDLPAEHRQLFGTLFFEGLPEEQRAAMIAAHPAFARDCGFEFRRVLGFGHGIRVSEEVLCGAAKDVPRRSSATIPVDIEGVGHTQAHLNAPDGDGLLLKWTDRDGKAHQVGISELTLMRENRAARELVARELLKRFGPAIPRETQALLERAGVRRLSTDEMSVLFREELTGVAAIQSRLVESVSAGQMMLGDLVPRSMFYWERFCGPIPRDEDPERYFTDDLIPYRRSLIKADVARGIDICCLGALRDDLSPGAWLEGIDDETIFYALGSVSPEGNPISLLGALDIALHRSDDKRFRDLAERTTRMLLDEQLGFDDYDAFRLFEILSEAAMNHLTLTPGAGKCPGFWRRMCAWMQAGLIARTFVACGAVPEVDGLEGWCQSQMWPAGKLLCKADWRREPGAPGRIPGIGGLRNEVVLRLGRIKKRHELSGKAVPMAAEIDTAVSAIQDDMFALSSARMGAPEMHLPPDEPVPDDAAEQLAEIWDSKGSAYALVVLATISTGFVLPENERGKVREVVASAADRPTSEDYVDKAPQLNAAAAIAGITGDIAMADAVGCAIVSFAPSLPKANDIDLAVHILLQAAAANREHQQWLDWLKKRFVEMAGSLPSSGDRMGRFLYLLEQLDIALPVRSWFHARAKRLAVTGLEATNDL